MEAREILKEENREDLKIISKIESVTGIENLDEIIKRIIASDDEIIREV